MPRSKKTEAPTVDIDVSLNSVLVVCSCGWRSDIEPSRRAAWAAAHGHYLRVHPMHGQYVLDRMRYHGG